MQLSPTHRRWLASAALRQIMESPAGEAAPGTAALKALLAGTPSAESAAELHDLTTRQAAAIRQILLTLDEDTPAFP